MILLGWFLACTPNDGGDDSEGLAPLAIVALAPASGSSEGGTVVDVTGSGFEGDLIVTVGTDLCVALSIPSAERLSCTTPGGKPGVVSLEVTRPADGAIAATTFTYTEGGTDGTDDSGTDDSGGTSPHPVDYCHLQWPCSMKGSAGGTSESVYVRVYHEGVTDQTGAGPGLRVQVGSGADGSDPSAWMWSEAVFNVDATGLDAHVYSDDEFMGTFGLPTKAGSYDYAGRASIDGGTSWVVCDLGGNSCGGLGSTDGYSTGSTGTLTVH